MHENSKISPLVAVEKAFAQTLEEVLCLLSANAEPRVSESDFQRLLELLEALPLASGLYCFALGWIASAQKQAMQGEWGLAVYQLRIVKKKLVGAVAS